MSIELKIKSKHLSVEAQIIRFEENKLRKTDQETFFSLRNHRRWDVRNENRATFLARAFLSGRPYKTIEQNVQDKVKFNAYIAPRALTMINKYGSEKITKEDFQNWVDQK